MVSVRKAEKAKIVIALYLYFPYIYEAIVCVCARCDYITNINWFSLRVGFVYACMFIGYRRVLKTCFWICILSRIAQAHILHIGLWGA